MACPLGETDRRYLGARYLSIMPFTSCVSFVSDAGKRYSCPSWLMAALGIGFGNVLLTDLFDVLFVRIYSDVQVNQILCAVVSSDSIRIVHRL